MIVESGKGFRKGGGGGGDESGGGDSIPPLPPSICALSVMSRFNEMMQDEQQHL